MLSAPGALKALAKQIKDDIDNWCVKTFDEGPRSHLGASQIGHKCDRYLWMQFRWIKHKTHDGRQYRLFQRGHFEEPRFKSYLEGIGCKVTEFDADRIDESDKGKRQIRISGAKGHFGGSVDAIVELPERYGLGQVLFLGEYKTQGTGRKFVDLMMKGCEIEKHQHFCQQSIYGYKLNLKYGIYIVVNKNDDDLYIEIVELDWKLGKQLEEKAEQIIFTQEPPTKIGMSAKHYDCTYCDVKEVCWGMTDKIDITCRSCSYCKPVEDAQWYCEFYNGIIPDDKEHTNIKNACNSWKSILK